MDYFRHFRKMPFYRRSVSGTIKFLESILSKRKPVTPTNSLPEESPSVNGTGENNGGVTPPRNAESSENEVIRNSVQIDLSQFDSYDGEPEEAPHVPALPNVGKRVIPPVRQPVVYLGVVVKGTTDKWIKLEVFGEDNVTVIGYADYIRFENRYYPPELEPTYRSSYKRYWRSIEINYDSGFTESGKEQSEDAQCAFEEFLSDLESTDFTIKNQKIPRLPVNLTVTQSKQLEEYAAHKRDYADEELKFFKQLAVSTSGRHERVKKLEKEKQIVKRTLSRAFLADGRRNPKMGPQPEKSPLTYMAPPSPPSNGGYVDTGSEECGNISSWLNAPCPQNKNLWQSGIRLHSALLEYCQVDQL
jgi:hypothetical protein